jgi:hypothetical protein
MLRLAWITTALAAAAVPVGIAQSRTQADTPCPGNWNRDRDRVVYCETREDTFAGSSVDVDASRKRRNQRARRGSH